MEDETLYRDRCPNCGGGYDFSEEEARMEAEGLSSCYRVCTRCGMEWEVRTKGDKQPEYLEDFEGPDEYNKYLGRGFGAFTVATRNIMKQRNMTFAETCTFLEEQGYLTWAGDWPLYNLAGDVLWNEDYGKKIEVERPREDERCATYVQRQEMKCFFLALVVRNEALECKFDGGLKQFLDQYPYCTYNDDICVFCERSYGGLREPVDDISTQGLIEGVDFVVFWPELYCPHPTWVCKGLIENGPDYPNIDFGIPWLAGRCLEEGCACMVSYNGDIEGIADTEPRSIRPKYIDIEGIFYYTNIRTWEGSDGETRFIMEC